MAQNLSRDEQFGALAVLSYVSDLFAVSGRESFSPVEVLVLLNAVREDPEVFDAEVVIAYEEATAGLEVQAVENFLAGK